MEIFSAVLTSLNAEGRVRRMNYFRSVGLGSLLCTFLADSPMASGSVRVIELLKSAQNPRITVYLDEKPVRGVKLEVHRGFNASNRALIAIVTDENGQAVLPKLAPAKYLIVGSQEPNLESELYLEVSSASANKPNRFSMVLEHFDLPLTYEELVAAAEQSTDVKRYVKFRGVVLDQSKAEIHGASIDVVVNGTQGKTHATRLRSDHFGRFSARLAEGSYVAVFSFPGFKVRYFPLTITKTGGDNDMQVVLNVADATE